MLTPEARHFVKVADLDWLEQFVRQGTDLVDIASDFEAVFAGLDKRQQVKAQKVLDWGQRYIAWAKGFHDRDGLPVLGTSWAHRMVELAVTADRSDLALSAVETILASYAPLEKERRVWEKNRYILTSGPRLADKNPTHWLTLEGFEQRLGPA